MPVIITRIYDTEDKARQAEAELKQQTVVGQVTVVTPRDGDSAEATLAANGMSAASAKTYAEAVKQDRYVVSVEPTFGRAAAVTQVLDSIGPVDTHISDVPETVAIWKMPRSARAGDTGAATAATPRAGDQMAPLSRFLAGRLFNDPTPASGKLGSRVLLDNPTPLSSRLGLRTCWQAVDHGPRLAAIPHHFRTASVCACCLTIQRSPPIASAGRPRRPTRRRCRRGCAGPRCRRISRRARP